VQGKKMLVIAAPGQGAQTPGFLKPWLEFPGVEELIGSWSELIGTDLIRYGTVGDADEIRDTAVAQPLLVAAALAASRVLGIGSRVHAGIVTGHSVGELGAGAIAGIVTGNDAMRLVGVRGQAMAQAAAIEPTSMTAVLGGDEADVLACLARHGLTPANINGAGQIVAAGTVAQLAEFAADPPARAKLRSLPVAGAFHTTHMASATEALKQVAATIDAHDPVLTVLSNADGTVVRTGADWLDRIVTQVSAPVRWDKCMATMQHLHATAFIELPPAGTLVGLARRALPGVALLALKTPADLDAALREEDATAVVATARGLEDRWPDAVEEALQHGIRRGRHDDEARDRHAGGVEGPALVPLVRRESQGPRVRSRDNAALFQCRNLIEVDELVVERDDLDEGGQFIERVCVIGRSDHRGVRRGVQRLRGRHPGERARGQGGGEERGEDPRRAAQREDPQRHHRPAAEQERR